MCSKLKRYYPPPPPALSIHVHISVCLRLYGLQACCLMVFSEEPNSLVLGEVSQRMHLSDDIVKRTLHSLSCGKYKVLKREGEGGSIKATDKVSTLVRRRQHQQQQQQLR